MSALPPAIATAFEKARNARAEQLNASTASTARNASRTFTDALSELYYTIVADQRTK